METPSAFVCPSIAYSPSLLLALSSSSPCPLRQYRSLTRSQRQYHRIPIIVSTITAARWSVARVAALCLPRHTGIETSPPARTRHLDQGAVLGRSGAPCIGRPCTETTCSRCDIRVLHHYTSRSFPLLACL